MNTTTSAAPALTGAGAAGLNPAQARVWARLNNPPAATLPPLDADWLDMERRAEQHARLDGDD